MSCENKLTNLVFKNKENSVKTQCASFFLPIFPLYIYLYIYRIKKKNQNEMHECYAMQILETKKNKKQWSQRIEMKHKDHVRMTQLD